MRKALANLCQANRRLAAVAATGAVAVSVSAAHAANIVIGTFDTGIDIETFLTGAVAVFAPLFLLMLSIKYGYRIIKTVANAGSRLFSSRA